MKFLFWILSFFGYKSKALPPKTENELPEYIPHWVNEPESEGGVPKLTSDFKKLAESISKFKEDLNSDMLSPEIQKYVEQCITQNIPKLYKENLIARNDSFLLGSHELKPTPTPENWEKTRIAIVNKFNTLGIKVEVYLQFLHFRMKDLEKLVEMNTSPIEESKLPQMNSSGIYR